MEGQNAQNSDRIRLNRYIANAGVCSRREADNLIANGEIKVNGTIVKEMGFRVSPKDKVEHNGVLLSKEMKVYILLNKPKGFVTTTKDPHAKRNVIDLIANACDERVYPVGRLDKDTTGVLLLTNDGDLSQKLTHPKFNKKKIYHVVLDKSFTKEDFDKLNKGMELEDGFIKPDALSFVAGQDDKQVGVEIHSGKNRIVRRMFAHLGYEVVKLDRVLFAGLTKKNVMRGKFRFLTDKEVKFLKML